MLSNKVCVCVKNVNINAIACCQSHVKLVVLS
jgi:hypothetical protein